MNKSFIFHTVVRHLIGLKEVPIKRFEDLQIRYTDFMEKLSSLAFKGLNDDRLVFSIHEIEFEVNDELFKNGFGLLQPLQYYNTEEIDTFNFLHFTLQEFLAAYYVSTLPPKQQSSYMTNTFWEDRFAYMWVMYVGIVGVKNNVFIEFISGGKTYKYKDDLKITDTIQKDKRKRLHLFQCYMEAKSKAEMPKLISFMFSNGEIKFNKVSLHPHHISSLTFFMSAQSTVVQWKALELENSYLNDIGMNALEQFVVDNKDKIATLEYVNLSENPVSPWCVYCALINNCQVNTLTLCVNSMQNYLNEIKESLQNTHKLKILKLFNVDCSDLALLEEILQYGVTLGSLDLSWEKNPKRILLQTVYNSITVSIYSDILDSNKFSSHFINISDKNIGYQEALFLAFGLYNNVTLAKLNMSHNHISDDGVKAISNSLKENTVLKELDVSRNNMTNNGVIPLVRAIKNLEKLNISGLSISDSGAEFIGCHLKENDKLLHLNMSNIATTKEGAKKFLEVFQINATLTVLYIHNINLSDDGMPALSAYLGNSILQEPDVSQNRITDEGLKVISEVIEVNTSLCKFDVSKNLISSEGLIYLLKKVSNNKTSRLQYLCISHNDVTKSSWNSVKECIKNVSLYSKVIASWNEINLKSIKQYNSVVIITTIYLFESRYVEGIEDTSQIQFVKEIRSAEHRIRYIASCLVKNNLLTAINLSGIGITEIEAKTFSKVIHCNSVLHTLNIAQNELGDDGIAIISESLKENTMLHTLNLSYNDITHAGAKELAGAIQINEVLKNLNISNNNICGEGAVAILNSNLQKLNFSNNNITVKDAACIAKVIEENESLTHLYLFQPSITNKSAFHKTLLDSMHFNNTIIKLTLPWLNKTLDFSKHGEVQLLVKEINRKRKQQGVTLLKCSC